MLCCSVHLDLAVKGLLQAEKGQTRQYMVAVRHVCDSGEETRSETEIPHITSLHAFESDDYLELCAQSIRNFNIPPGHTRGI